MDRIYDIFERMPDGAIVLRGCAKGLDIATMKLDELARTSENEFYAIHNPTKEIIARANVGGVNGK